MANNNIGMKIKKKERKKKNCGTKTKNCGNIER